MMLHRHFERERNQNVTTLADLTPGEKREEVAPAMTEAPEEAPKRRGRKPKTGD